MKKLLIIAISALGLWLAGAAENDKASWPASLAPAEWSGRVTDTALLENGYENARKVDGVGLGVDAFVDDCMAAWLRLWQVIRASCLRRCVIQRLQEETAYVGAFAIKGAH